MSSLLKLHRRPDGGTVGRVCGVKVAEDPLELWLHEGHPLEVRRGRGASYIVTLEDGRFFERVHTRIPGRYASPELRELAEDRS
jgi:hypothetical protein